MAGIVIAWIGDVWDVTDELGRDESWEDDECRFANRETWRREHEEWATKKQPAALFSFLYCLLALPIFAFTPAAGSPLTMLKWRRRRVRLYSLHFTRVSILQMVSALLLGALDFCFSFGLCATLFLRTHFSFSCVCVYFPSPRHLSQVLRYPVSPLLRSLSLSLPHINIVSLWFIMYRPSVISSLLRSTHRIAMRNVNRGESTLSDGPIEKSNNFSWFFSVSLPFFSPSLKRQQAHGNSEPVFLSLFLSLSLKVWIKYSFSVE